MMESEDDTSDVAAAGAARDGPGPRQRIPTLEEVARHAGVSLSAASRTFTPGASASKATRAKVGAAARALGYRPNLLARSLSRRRTDTVAIAITRLENAFHADLLQALSLGLRARGYGVMLFVAAEENADPCIDDILKHRVGGLLLCAVGMSSHLRKACGDVGVHVVMVNRATASAADTSVVGSNRAGAATVAAFLLAAGHRRMAFISGTEGSSTSLERGNAFSDALVSAGCEAPLSEGGHFDQAGAAAAARRLLGLASPPDALFCADDHMAYAAVAVAAKEFGLRPGQTISVVGFDDATPARLGAGLTTFAQSASEMAEAAIRTLDDLMAGRPSRRRQVVPGRLLVRGSSRAPGLGCTMDVDGQVVWSEPAAVSCGRPVLEVLSTSER